MRFKIFINEMSASKKNGITFFDIDETLYHTFAKIKVIKDGKVVKELDNQQFNTYKLKPGETYNFDEFRDASLFSKTSIPIKKTINRVKKMLSSITTKGKDSKIVFLTARADFDDKHTFLKRFKKDGIDIDKIYVERAGNMQTGTVAERKKKIIMKYLESGKYLKVRMVDDDITNLKHFLSIKNEIPESVYEAVRKYYKDDTLGPDDMEFYALLVTDSGKLKLIDKY
jgi:hypothetical protein